MRRFSAISTPPGTLLTSRYSTDTHVFQLWWMPAPWTMSLKLRTLKMRSTRGLGRWRFSMKRSVHVKGVDWWRVETPGSYMENVKLLLLLFSYCVANKFSALVRSCSTFGPWNFQHFLGMLCQFFVGSSQHREGAEQPEEDFWNPEATNGKGLSCTGWWRCAQGIQKGNAQETRYQPNTKDRTLWPASQRRGWPPLWRDQLPKGWTCPGWGITTVPKVRGLDAQCI